MADYANNPIAQLIIQSAKQTGADPLTMLATSIVESGLNPSAVGDNGTSFGLFQHHIGGAGGRTRKSATRFHDPKTSVSERARAFRGGKGGRFAASIQRPADAAGYARKVDATIRQLRAGKLPTGVLNAPVQSSKRARVPQASAPTGLPAPSVSAPDPRSLAASIIFDDSPGIAQMLVSKLAPQPTPTMPVPVAAPQKDTQRALRVPTSGDPRIDKIMRSNLPKYARLKRVGEVMFGLRNDPGNSQLTGGGHRQGSLHYSNAAVDFGDARNQRSKLNAWLKWAQQNRKRYGFREVLDEGDHIHVGW